MPTIEEQLVVLETENFKMKEPLSIMNEKSRKIKGQASSLLIELEASLTLLKQDLL